MFQIEAVKSSVQRLIIVGNWKMNKLLAEARQLVSRLRELTPAVPGVQVVLAPPFTAIHAVKEALAGSDYFNLAGQDLYWEGYGPFTGEISAPMLRDSGCSHVIIGHSERRQHFGEDDQGINKKVRAALQHELSPILCVGETLPEREAGQTDTVVTRQLLRGLDGLNEAEVGRIMVAYEPVWAIGTGRAATVEQAEAVQGRLRRILRETWSRAPGEPTTPILYGGSVTPVNAGELLNSKHVDGALVGGACLDPEAFAKIIQSAQTCVRAS